MEQLAYLAETQCCGIRELDCIMDCKNARQAVVDAAQGWHEGDADGAYIFFSCTGTSTIGKEIEEYIAKYKLGTVQKTRPTRNPNSGHMLTMWVWTVNKRNFKAFWHKTKRYKQNYKSEEGDY